MLAKFLSRQKCWRNLASNPGPPGCRFFSAEPEKIQHFRTAESNPAKHDARHIGRIYTISPEEFKFAASVVDEEENSYFLPIPFYQRSKVLEEYSVLVRRPAVEIISYLQQIDWKSNKNMAKFVLWGAPGCGKTVSMAHVTHFGLKSNYIVLQFHKLQNYYRFYKEAVQSEYKENRWDFPNESKRILVEFLEHNKDKLDGAVLHKDYNWSEKESSSKGTPLIDLVAFGIERSRFSADCLYALMAELGANGRSGLLANPVMVTIDGINSLFEERTGVSKSLPKRSPRAVVFDSYMAESCTPDELGLCTALKKMLRENRSDTCFVSTVDKTVKWHVGLRGPKKLRVWWRNRDFEMRPDTTSDLPFDLLGNDGWQLLDPFVPVEVSPYSAGELDAMIDFYVDKHYIKEVAASPNGRQEIHFVTGRKPHDFMHYSNYW